MEYYFQKKVNIKQSVIKTDFNASMFCNDLQVNIKQSVIKTLMEAS